MTYLRAFCSSGRHSVEYQILNSVDKKASEVVKSKMKEDHQGLFVHFTIFYTKIKIIKKFIRKILKRTLFLL